LTGGKRSGTFYAPTVLENLPPNCTLSSQEVYGPVTVLCRFHTLEEAIRLANSTDYGLQAGIFTRDIQTAFRAIAGLRCGGVMVNDSTDYRIDSMPFGGVKGSGLGREGVQFAVQEMTEPTVVCISLEEMEKSNYELPNPHPWRSKLHRKRPCYERERSCPPHHDPPQAL